MSQADAMDHDRLDDLFHLLRNRRRRAVIHHLDGRDEPIDARRLAEFIAARENDTTVAGLSSDQRNRTYIALYQCHLEPLAEAGLIDYNRSRGDVESTPLLDDVAEVIDFVAATLVEGSA